LTPEGYCPILAPQIISIFGAFKTAMKTGEQYETTETSVFDVEPFGHELKVE
jgi:hypothetical protein